MYMAIKELFPVAEDVIMVTSILMRDLHDKQAEANRPNALRALLRLPVV